MTYKNISSKNEIKKDTHQQNVFFVKKSIVEVTLLKCKVILQTIVWIVQLPSFDNSKHL